MAIFNLTKKEMIREALTYLYAIYGKRCVDGFIKRYGTDVLFHRSITDESDHRIYCYPVAENLILSKYRMEDMADSATDNIDSLLLTSVETQRTVYNQRPVYLFTWLVSGADSRPVTPAGTLRWTDKRNTRNTYREYQSLLSTATRQLRENRSLDDTTFLASDIENPWHSRNDNTSDSTVRDIYSHAHTHGLVATTDPNEAQALEQVLRNDFIGIFGYKPTCCNVCLLTDYDEPAVIGISRKRDFHALDAVDKFIRYIFHDYHIQTKDCADFGKLPSQVRHIIVMAQLASTKRKRVQRYVRPSKPRKQMPVSQDDVRANPTVISNLVARNVLSKIVHQESTNRENGNGSRGIRPIVVNARHVSYLFDQLATEPATATTAKRVASSNRDPYRSPISGVVARKPEPASNSPPLQVRTVDRISMLNGKEMDMHLNYMERLTVKELNHVADADWGSYTDHPNDDYWHTMGVDFQLTDNMLKRFPWLERCKVISQCLDNPLVQWWADCSAFDNSCYNTGVDMWNNPDLFGQLAKYPPAND